MVEQFTRYVATINNYQFDEPLYDLEDHEYFLCGKEVGESGTPHQQIYGILKRKKRIAGIQRLYKQANIHVEKARGTDTECITYIKGPYTKNDKHKPINTDIIEHGTVPLNEQDRWKKAKIEAVQGNWESVPEDILIRYIRNLQTIRTMSLTANDEQEPTGILIWGNAGIGKSHLARNSFGSSYFMKSTTIWWGTYNGEETVIMDDLDPTKAEKLKEELKIWTDKYAFEGETKGGHTGKIRPKNFIITSQYSPDILFPEIQTLEAMSRRLDVIKLERVGNIRVTTITKRKNKEECITQLQSSEELQSNN